jgi:4-hydroxy-tetrahydrodipicolinate reductase
MKSLAIVGGSGRMGQVMAHGLHELDDFKVQWLVDLHEPRAVTASLWAPHLADVDPQSIDAVVDFSVPESVVTSAQWCAEQQKLLVIGTTGLSDEQLAAVGQAAQRTGIVMCANFAIGAILAMRFAAMAAPFFDGVEIIELHHDQKVDAPSGTSITTARAIAQAREDAGLGAVGDPTKRQTIPGARGATANGGIKIHSVRLPGLTAHEEILFGGPGEGLTIRHDSFDRKSFVHGVAVALRNVRPDSGLVVGIDSYLP